MTSKKSQTPPIDIGNFAKSLILAGSRLKLDSWRVMEPFYPRSCFDKTRLPNKKGLFASLQRRCPVGMQWFSKVLKSSDHDLLERPELWTRDVVELFMVPIEQLTNKSDDWAPKSTSSHSFKGEHKRKGFQPLEEVESVLETTRAPKFAKAAQVHQDDDDVAMKSTAKYQRCCTSSCDQPHLELRLIADNADKTSYYACKKHFKTEALAFRASLQQDAQREHALKSKAARAALCTKNLQHKDSSTSRNTTPHRKLSMATLQTTQDVDLQEPAAAPSGKGDFKSSELRCTGIRKDGARCATERGTTFMGPTIGRRCYGHRSQVSAEATAPGGPTLAKEGIRAEGAGAEVLLSSDVENDSDVEMSDSE